MLKWSVTARREAERPDLKRRQTLDLSTITPRIKTKRRRSTTNRRSVDPRRSSLYNRNSLDLKHDKENQFTSTPIKSSTECQLFDPLRDLSNLSPKIIRTPIKIINTRHNFGNHVSKESPERLLLSSKKSKKKKRCVNPFHQDVFDLNESSNYFKNLETVDSHIEAFSSDYKCHCENENDGNRNKRLKFDINSKKRLPDIYAPTLPTFATDYSPCSMKTTHCLATLNKASPSRTSPLKKLLTSSKDNWSPSSNIKIDHVNDFLQQISFVTSPEENCTNLDLEANSKPIGRSNVKVSPLVKQFVALGLRNIGIKFNENGVYEDNYDDSSYINELSLDQIVDAILDTTEESVKEVEEMEDFNSNLELRLQRENDLNETREDNLINSDYERQTLSGNFSDRCSSDSGFKSSTTETSHQLESDFKCKCSKRNNTIIECKNLVCDKTIININETFNERCVDTVEVNRKRRSSELSESKMSKRVRLDQFRFDTDNCTLKRQKCIRRRKIDKFQNIENCNIELSDTLRPSNYMNSSLRICDNESIYDNSFESSIISECDNSDSLSFYSSPKNTIQQTLILSTPVDRNRRFRRCLLFESPKVVQDISYITSSPTAERLHTYGILELSIQKLDNEVAVNIHRGKNLFRRAGIKVNSYVKVYISNRSGKVKFKRNGTLQRTAVQADSNEPLFNHVFRYPISNIDVQERLQIEVWHRERLTRTSEFLGCMSFSIQNDCNRDIYGSYRLLPQSKGRFQNLPITLNNCFDTINGEEFSTRFQRKMCESQCSIEETISVDDLDNDLQTTNKSTIVEQQKHADENLFLRYLELDPVEGPDAIPAATQRRATGIKNGRTPFTHTKRLTRPPKSGFGFSVVWTHPPRIERVEKGLPADRAGILPGDYLIFVDKHNVVMMPEIDILNLIRSYGSQLTLEIFRRNTSKNGSVPSVRRLNSTGTVSSAILPLPTSLAQRRPSTVCSTNTTSIDCSRRKLHLPQVTFSAERPSSNPEENRNKAMYQLISKEQQYATGLQFAITRFVSALAERKDLITPAEHRTLFQNAEEILRITEDLLEHFVQDDGELQINLLSRTYLSKLNEMTSAYKRYCSGIKKAGCVLANKTKNCNSEFVRFIHTPEIPRRRPDITSFIHKPLEHLREVLKLLTVIQSLTKPSHEDHVVINQVVHDLQVAYKEITSEAGLMEPTGGGRPLLTVQDLENRLVFTKCKPFILNKPGRQWIFGGDLSRIEGRNVRQYWTLLFSDLLLFAKVSRDRVLFIIEDPIPLAHVTDMFFNIRKKDTEFRIAISPEGRLASSPTVHCGPDLTRTPRKNSNRRTIVLRAPCIQLKAMWQNLLQRQIFHVNAGMDGSSFSSPLESPEAPITSSVVTLQSAESLSLRRQTPHNINQNNNTETQRQIDALIEHKCKQLSKSNDSSKGNAIHLEKWMKGQLATGIADTAELEPLAEEWSPERVRKRSEELHLIDCQGNVICRHEVKRNESRCEENFPSDNERSSSRSTTTESQVTVRSSPPVPETIGVCRQCHKNCLASVNEKLLNSEFEKLGIGATPQESCHVESEDDWRPIVLFGLSAVNPAAKLVKLDPFQRIAQSNHLSNVTFLQDCKVNESKTNCNCTNYIKNNQRNMFDEAEASTDDSPQTEEHPYHSLSSSNLTIRRFGTVSSLEKFGMDDKDEYLEQECSSESEDETECQGIENEAFNPSSIMTWTTRAGLFVAEKMSFFEKLGGDYRSGGGFFDRYLKSSDSRINGDDIQDEETSGATSGEDIWGTPTSGELDDSLHSPSYEGKQSPNDGSISSENNEDTELMMDELLMTPPITGAIMRGLLPRRTLEPLIEEDISDSNSSSPSMTPTETSISPEQGKETGIVADTCSTAAENQIPGVNTKKQSMPSVVVTFQIESTNMPRSESYRKIVEAADEPDEDDHLGFFNRFRPTARFTSIEKVPKSKGVRIFEFFNVRKLERRVHETYPEEKEFVKMFGKSGTVLDNVSTVYSQKQSSPKKLKDKQMDRRFWKQLSKRRGTKSSNLPA